jgi:hypothetical protein
VTRDRPPIRTLELEDDLSWAAFRAARARFLAMLAGQSAIIRLERAWRLPHSARSRRASPISRVPSSPPRSRVRAPASRAEATAASIRSASSGAASE